MDMGDVISTVAESIFAVLRARQRHPLVAAAAASAAEAETAAGYGSHSVFAAAAAEGFASPNVSFSTPAALSTGKEKKKMRSLSPAATKLLSRVMPPFFFSL